MRQKLALITSLAGIITILASSQAFAHVVVKPGEVLTGAYETFSVSVPNERDVPVTEIKINIPEGVTSVTPTVKPGWTVSVDKSSEAEDATVRSITWSGGSIPADLRDDFTFSAKAPDKPTDLRWKANQTYQDGSAVSWSVAESEQPKKPDGSPDFSKFGPFSVTSVQTTESDDDRSAASAETDDNESQIATVIATLAALVSLVALYFATRKRPTKSPGKSK